MKVIKEFYCIKDCKPYKVGDTYSGNRTDLGNLLEEPKKVIKKKKK